MGDKSEQKDELMEQKNGLVCCGFTSGSQGVHVFVVDLVEHIFLVICIFFGSDGWDGLLHEGAKIFDA